MRFTKQGIWVFSFLLLCAPLKANSIDWGRIANINEGYNEAEEKARQRRISQLKLEEANRKAEIDRLEHQIKMRELRAREERLSSQSRERENDSRAIEVEKSMSGGGRLITTKDSYVTCLRNTTANPVQMKIVFPDGYVTDGSIPPGGTYQSISSDHWTAKIHFQGGDRELHYSKHRGANQCGIFSYQFVAQGQRLNLDMD